MAYILGFSAHLLLITVSLKSSQLCSTFRLPILLNRHFWPFFTRGRCNILPRSTFFLSLPPLSFSFLLIRCNSSVWTGKMYTCTFLRTLFRWDANIVSTLWKKKIQLKKDHSDEKPPLHLRQLAPYQRYSWGYILGFSPSTFTFIDSKLTSSFVHERDHLS